MVWHIFRKDCKLLWPTVVGVALINLLQRAIQSSAGIFRNASLSPQVALSGLLGTLSLLATAVLIVMAVQEDRIPGPTQDWLVLPIRRRDLLLGKVLFVALMIQAPVFLIEVGQCLAAGFPIGSSLAAPLSRSAWMFLAMDIPVLAFATLTRSLAQAAGAAIAIVLGYALFTTATLFYLNPAIDNIWVKDLAQVAWGLAGAAVVLSLQYYRRKTTRARWMYGAAALVWLMLQFLPWQPAFSIEKRFSPQPAAANPVQIVFDPTFGKFRGERGGSGQLRIDLTTGATDVDIWAPLRISGLGEGQMLTTDRVVVRLSEPAGTKLDLGRLAARIPWNVQGSFHYLVFIPEDIYDRLKDRPVDMQIDYSLTLLQAKAPKAMPVGGNQWINGVGRCATRTGPRDSQIELGCAAPGSLPCATWTVENQRNGQRHVERSGCAPDYAPYFGRVVGDSISRFAREFPIANPRSNGSQIMVRIYRPEAHFTRQVVIPNIRLSDWRPESL